MTQRKLIPTYLMLTIWGFVQQNYDQFLTPQFSPWLYTQLIFLIKKVNKHLLKNVWLLVSSYIVHILYFSNIRIRILIYMGLLCRYSDHFSEVAFIGASRNCPFNKNICTRLQSSTQITNCNKNKKLARLTSLQNDTLQDANMTQKK